MRELHVMVSKLAFMLTVGFIAAFNVGNEHLVFDSNAIAHGEFWRVLTCNLVHRSFAHLALDLAAMILMLPFVDFRRDALFMVFTSVFIGAGLFVCLDVRYSYGGLSGLLYGIALRLLWAERRRVPLKNEFVLAVSALLGGKLIYDLLQFPSTSLSAPDSVLIPQAHLLGALGAVIWCGSEEWQGRFALRKAKRSQGWMTLLVLLPLSLVVNAPLVQAEVESASSVHEQSLSRIPWIDYRRLSFNLGVGFVRGSVTQDEVASDLEKANISLDEFSLNINRPGYQIGMAYEISDNFHVELMYFNFGKVAVEASSTGITEEQLAAAFQDRLPGTGAGPFVAVKANKWIVSPYHRLFARIGAFAATSGYDLTGGTTISRRETSFIVGGGYEFFYRKGLSVRAEVNATRLNNEMIWYVGPTLVAYLDGVPREPMPEKAEATAQALPPSSAPTDSLKLAIYFDFDRDIVTDIEKQKIRQVKSFLESHPGTIALLSGHTDSYGTNDYNMDLSDRRVQAVLRAMREEEKIPDHRLKTIGHYGEERAADGNWTSKGRQQNRRVNICVVTDREQEAESCLGTDQSKSIPVGDLRTICRSDTSVAVIEARFVSGSSIGCQVRLMERDGSWTPVGSSNSGLELCHRIMLDTKARLERSGMNCQDE